MTNSESNEGEESIHLSLQTLTLVVMLIVYITAGPLLKRSKLKFIQASGVTMIVGIIWTFIVKCIYPQSSFFKAFKFNDVFFFTFVLPWIIFRIGYNTKLTSCLKYFKYIIAISLIGTVISFILIAALTYIFDVYNVFNIKYNQYDDRNTLHLHIYEIFQFAAAITANDAIGAINLIANDDAKLNAIAEGDGVINNAICIALFKIARNLSESDSLSGSLCLEMIVNCVVLFVVSFIVGGLVGLLFAYFLKKVKIFKLNRVQEISLMLLFAFISYIVCDWAHLSPMIAVLSSALFMSHYAFYNFAFQTREESALISVVLNTLSEALVFSLLGMSLIYFTTHSFSLSFLIVEIIIIIVTRIVVLVSLTKIMESTMSFSLPFQMQSILTAMGSMRGAISFGLGVTISSADQLNSDIMTATIVFIVFITNIFFSAIMPLFTSKEQSVLKDITDDAMMQTDIVTYMHPNTKIKSLEPKPSVSSEEMEEQIDDGLLKKIEKYDEDKVMPVIIGDWKEIMQDNDNLATLIKRALKEWSENKMKGLGNWSEENRKEDKGIYKIVGGIGVYEPKDNIVRTEMNVLNDKTNK